MRRALLGLRWWWLTRRLRHRPDGMRMGSGAGAQLYEVVCPRWWDLRRWAAWLRAEGEVTLSLLALDGAPALFVLRVRIAEQPAQAPQYSRRSMVPRPLVSQARREEDPRLRTLPDDFLERHGITFRDDGEGW